MGIDSVGIHVESFDPQVLARVAPGKARLGHRGLLHCLGAGGRRVRARPGVDLRDPRHGRGPEAHRRGLQAGHRHGRLPVRRPAATGARAACMEDLLPPPRRPSRRSTGRSCPYLARTGMSGIGCRGGMRTLPGLLGPGGLREGGWRHARWTLVRSRWPSTPDAATGLVCRPAEGPAELATHHRIRHAGLRRRAGLVPGRRPGRPRRGRRDHPRARLRRRRARGNRAALPARRRHLEGRPAGGAPGASTQRRPGRPAGALRRRDGRRAGRVAHGGARSSRATCASSRRSAGPRSATRPTISACCTRQMSIALPVTTAMRSHCRRLVTPSRRRSKTSTISSPRRSRTSAGVVQHAERRGRQVAIGGSAPTRRSTRSGGQ